MRERHEESPQRLSLGTLETRTPARARVFETTSPTADEGAIELAVEMRREPYPRSDWIGWVAANR
jgi:hypothetical protein